MPNLLPFRQVAEWNIVNLYRYSGAIPVTKGTFVVIVSGWDTTQELAELGDVGAHYNRVVSQRYGVQAQVAKVSTTGTVAPFGLLLNDVRELDENNVPLIYNPRKQAELQAVLSGQAVPIATKGIFLYSGINGTPVAGQPAYSDGSGALSTAGATIDQVGKFLGQKNSQGHALVKIDL